MKFDRNVLQVKAHLSTESDSIDGVGFLILLSTFMLEAVISFRTEKCCHLVSGHAASARQQHAPVPDPLYVRSLFLCFCFVVLTKRSVKGVSYLYIKGPGRPPTNWRSIVNMQ